MNGDVLFTYRLNPWTALYCGYNNNFQNIGLWTTPTGNRVLRISNRLANDAYQVFVKFSYLLRF